MTRNFKLKLIGLFAGRHALAAMVASFSDEGHTGVVIESAVN
jgi:hypothetical protein